MPDTDAVGARKSTKERRQQIGAGVRRAREDAGLSQSELASKIGAGYGAIGEIERGVTAPNLSTAWQIADVLNVSLDDLVGRSPSEGGDGPRFRNPWPAIRAIQQQIDAMRAQGELLHGEEFARLRSRSKQNPQEQ